MKIIAKDMYALMCDESMYRVPEGKKISLNDIEQVDDLVLLCGVYASRREAMAAANEIHDCVCKHYVKKCSVEVTYK